MQRIAKNQNRPSLMNKAITGVVLVPKAIRVDPHLKAVIKNIRTALNECVSRWALL